MGKQQRTALLSVYHKDGIVDFAQELLNLNFKIISSGGTAKALSDAGVEVTDVKEITGTPPILSHRVVTLAEEIHGGLLAQDTPEHTSDRERHAIPWIDLVCVDLYPLKEEIANENATEESVLEKTDIGGPTMLRSAAKGRRIVIADPKDRPRVLEWLKEGEPDKEAFLRMLAAKVEYIVSEYTLRSARYHGTFDGMIGTRVSECSYGENPWQGNAYLYSLNTDDPLALDAFILTEGATPSFNNWIDIGRLLQTATHIGAGFERNWGSVPLIALGVKHGNACGAAVGNTPAEVVTQMIKSDPEAIFGGVVLLNFELGKAEAEILRFHQAEKGRGLDAILAPSITEEAYEVLGRKNGKCRFLTNPNLHGENLGERSIDRHLRYRFERGTFLTQDNYTYVLNLKDDDIFSVGDISESSKKDIVLAWAIGSTSNSNTTTLVKNGQLLGNGTGQQARHFSCEVALKRAKHHNHSVTGSVAYSDSFFPFTDGPEMLANAGVATIFASSGSMGDKKVIESLEKRGVSLMLIPDKKARGFFGH